jgi:hypothetical protein
MEVSIPVTVKGHRGCSKPAAAPAARLPRRRATDLNRYARALIRLRCGARALAGSLSISDLPPDKNRREMAEDGELESQRLSTPGRLPSGASALAGSSSKSGRRSTRN